MTPFTQNSKTIISLDFDRESTCGQRCPYCYVNTMERIYPSYLEKIKRNSVWAKENGKQFAVTLNADYKKLEKSKSKDYKRLKKLPVRIYGSGDFIPEHAWFLIDLEFQFFIISKNLTRPETKTYIARLLTLENLTTICLSFDDQNIDNYKGVSGYFGKPKIKFSYTGTADGYAEKVALGFTFNIFFNIDKKKSEREKSALIAEACPCDSGKLEHKESCSYCSKCWR